MLEMQCPHCGKVFEAHYEQGAPTVVLKRKPEPTTRADEPETPTPPDDDRDTLLGYIASGGSK